MNLNRRLRLPAFLLTLTAYLALGLCQPPLAPLWSEQAPETICGERVTLQVRNIPSGGQPLKLVGANSIWLKGDGDTLRRGPGGSANGLVLDSCRYILITGIQFTNWHDLKITNSHHLEFRNVKSFKNNHDCFLFSGVHDLLMRGCEGSRTGDSHAWYAGCYGNNQNANLTVEDSVFYGSGRAQVQGNSETGKAKITGMTFRRCKVTGSFAVNLLGTDATFEACDIKAPGGRAFVLDKPMGRPWPSTLLLKGGSCQGQVITLRGSKVVKQ